MKEGVGVRELNHTSDRNHLEMRDEGAVLLQKRVVALWCQRENRSVAHRFKPDNGGDTAMDGGRGLNVKAELGLRGAGAAILRAEDCRRQDECRCEPVAEP